MFLYPSFGSKSLIAFAFSIHGFHTTLSTRRSLCTSRRGLPSCTMDVMSCLMDLYTRSVSPVMRSSGVDCWCSVAFRTLSMYVVLPRPLTVQRVMSFQTRSVPSISSSGTRMYSHQPGSMYATASGTQTTVGLGLSHSASSAGRLYPVLRSRQAQIHTATASSPLRSAVHARARSLA
jgi:hypothetical protein